LLPESELPVRIVDREAFIDFLGPQDEPWLGVLLEEMARLDGKTRRELLERVAEPLPCEAPHWKRRAATRVLLRAWGREPVAAARSIAARAALFEAAAGRAAPVERVVAEVARARGTDPGSLLQSLFADLPGERIVRAPRPLPRPAEVALRTNLAVAQAVLMRASTVDLRVEGQVRPTVRLAKLRGLLCTVKQPAPGAAPVLEISGPFSLFRHTLLYGRALAALLPGLAWSARWALVARASLRGRVVDVALDKAAPLFPGPRPARFDSRLEERFARDFARLAPDWDLLREPEPIAADGTLVFPDFLVRHRVDQRRSVLVELVGFWTAEYVRKKLERLAAARIPRLLLCLDEELACGEGGLPASLPAHLELLRFRRRVDAAEVLRRVVALTI
jgi:uncharacterized protein